MFSDKYHENISILPQRAVLFFSIFDKNGTEKSMKSVYE